MANRWAKLYSSVIQVILIFMSYNLASLVMVGTWMFIVGNIHLVKFDIQSYDFFRSSGFLFIRPYGEIFGPSFSIYLQSSGFGLMGQLVK